MNDSPKGRKKFRSNCWTEGQPTIKNDIKIMQAHRYRYNNKSVGKRARLGIITMEEIRARVGMICSSGLICFLKRSIDQLWAIAHV